MQIITQAQLYKIREANESVKGTNNWNKYLMPLESKIDGKWKFECWTSPWYNRDGYIKHYKGKTYIMFDSPLGLERYTVTPEVAKLLNLDC